MLFYIRHEDNEDMTYDKKKKKWSVEDPDFPVYPTNRGKLPPHGVWEEYDDHVGCANWPNCDTEGCGYW